MSDTPTFEDFEALGLRVGTIVRAEPNDGAREPAYRLWVDLGGEVPVQSSGKLTDRYTPEDLVDRQVIVVTGFAPLRVGGFRSDVLLLGALFDGGQLMSLPSVVVPPGATVA